MIEEATADCYNQSEQIRSWFTAIDEKLAVPFETRILGVPVPVERVDLSGSEEIVAVCRRGRERQSRASLGTDLILVVPEREFLPGVEPSVVEYLEQLLLPIAREVLLNCLQPDLDSHRDWKTLSHLRYDHR